MARRRLLGPSAFFVVALGACALQPAARVARSDARSAETKPPRAEAPSVVERQEKRQEKHQEERREEPREAVVVARDESDDPDSEVAAKPTSRRGASTKRAASTKKPKKPKRRGAAGATSPDASAASAPEPDAPARPEEGARAERAAIARSPSLDLDPRDLSAARCRALLEEHGVRYEVKEGVDAEHLYVKPTGAIGGVTYEFVGAREVHEVMDCRLVVALLRWGPSLRSEGVQRIRHLSVYRPDARVASSGKRSGHASALAIDVRFVDFEDGRTLDVLADWGDRERGRPPCGEDSAVADPDPELRRITCDAVEDALFQTVITPHHDDLHQNHVHLELVPGVEWTFIR